MDENNNFLGFVSKIGSLINNNKKKKNEKKYNIKISVEDEQNLDNIDNQDDEEEEEEEEEDEKESENKKDNLKEIDKEKEKEINEEKEKIQNLVQEIIKNNDNDEEFNKEEENEDINDANDENNINNDNDNDINNNYNINNNIICPPILNNSFPVAENNDNNNNNIDNKNINGSNVSNTFVYDETTSCNIMLKKGNDININDYIIIPILFVEKQKNILYKMHMVNNPKYEPKKYLFFFDEHYLYFAKDEILGEEMDEETRRISKIISLFDIKDFSSDHDNGKFLIKLLVKKENNKEKEIQFYIEQNYFTGFIKNFNLKLSIYGIDFFSDKNKD